MPDKNLTVPAPGVRWEEPAPTRRGRSRHSASEVIRTSLRENPGKWLLLREKSPYATVGKSYPKPDFEVTVRSNGDGTYKVYVRYVGS